MKKYAIQDEAGRYLWGMTSRSVGFDGLMPQFWELNEQTKLFESAQSASAYAERHNLETWSAYRVVPLDVFIG